MTPKECKGCGAPVPPMSAYLYCEECNLKAAVGYLQTAPAMKKDEKGDLWQKVKGKHDSWYWANLTQQDTVTTPAMVVSYNFQDDMWHVSMGTLKAKYTNDQIRKDCGLSPSTVFSLVVKDGNVYVLTSYGTKFLFLTPEQFKMEAPNALTIPKKDTVPAKTKVEDRIEELEDQVKTLTELVNSMAALLGIEG